MSEYTWDKCFDNPNLIDEISCKAEAVAIICEAWGLCRVTKSPDSFGEVIVAIGKRFKIAVSDDGIKNEVKMLIDEDYQPKESA